MWLDDVVHLLSRHRLPQCSPDSARSSESWSGLRSDSAASSRTGQACEYLGDRPERNVGLDELAAAAGIGTFRLIRLFRERTGLPPHAFQVAHRIRFARRLLEASQTIAATAAATGFADQSHLHRHFQRSLGMTPGEYQRPFKT